MSPSDDYEFTTFLLSDRKLVDYLLNLDHVRGAPKARFFHAFGFTALEPQILGRALLEHAVIEHFVRMYVSELGDTRLNFRGPIKAPDGRNPIIRSVWQRVGRDTARFLTAHPD